ncbi:anaphase promoting complex subunit cdc16 [Dermatophagoides pteronyssinus]|uniref:Cell division cycle protein 16 homolog n=2 Tax=Dermatophagoides pteronyssinus TaxID=6956 RepID=A0A6P6XWV2_DERPT|nr:cell division cycle protein 16 homolog [Dermatophagoides pteronyssinus]KAH9414831.1 anaphase promoting complex subunit cdc16 [Dermatophagoides pteronyssinus]
MANSNAKSTANTSIFSTFNKVYNNMKITKEQIYSNVDEIKNIRDDFEQMFLIDTAKFFTDKLITLEQDHNDVEIYRMAKLLHQKEQYHRAALLITSNNFHLKNLSGRFLAAKCYFDCKEYSKSLELLNLPIDNLTFDEKGGSFDQWKSSIHLLKGHIHEALDDKELANKCFFDALVLDPFCYEAFQALIKFDMINKEQECQLLEFISSTNNDQSDKSEAINMMKELYNLQFHHHHRHDRKDVGMNTEDENEQQKQSSSSLTLLNNSLFSSDDVRLIHAENYYNDCQFKKSYAILSEIHSNDNLNQKCLFLMIGCLLELNNDIVLQEISHNLAEAIPENAIAWYAVGCYYYATSNMDNARKYLSKSTLIDPNFQASMLMYGHSFEMEALHDQAIAVYMDLSKIMAHSYLPILYVGVEYCHLNFPSMAEQYLNQALELSPDNLFVLHELGIVFYEKKEYEIAKDYFKKVYKILADKKLLMEYPQKWEPLLNNLGHVHRKLGEYDDAINYFKIAIRMIPENSSTLDALGLVYGLKGELQMASDYFQKALSLKRDDAFALTMYHLLSD